MPDNNLEQSKQELLAEIDRRIEDKIIEQTNADLLKKLINNADTLTEAVAIAELGTTYRRTGLHFDKRLEKFTDTIKYFKKNDDLSFRTDEKGVTHKLIIGDNYDALLNLLVEYRGMIDVIYIDPPYGKDSMGEFAETNYDNAITRDNLLSMLYPRLELAKQLLSEDGVIFCSMDDRNQAYVKCLFDEVFGERNFEGNIHWRRRSNQPNDKTKMIGLVAEHILVYSKNLDYHRQAGIGKVNSTGKFSNPDNDPRGPWTSKPWKISNGRNGSTYAIKTPSGKTLEGTWSGSKKTFEEHIKNNTVHWTNGGDGFPRIKVFQSSVEGEGQCANNWWPWEEFGSNNNATEELKSIFGGEYPFENPKPVKLIKAIIKLGSIKDNAKVLDFFAGSGTTGHAVMDLNRDDDGKREFILVTNNEENQLNPNGIAVDVTTKRLKRIMTGECYDGNKKFDWIKNNEPYGDNLDVYDIETVANFESSEGKTPFDVIDETLYDKEKMNSKEKIKWVCENFDNTQKSVEKDSDYKKRIEGAE